MSATLEDLIQGFVATATGLAGDHVIWMYQDRDRPTDDYMTLRWDNDQTIGTPENLVRDNPTPTEGSEILLSSKELVEFEIHVQAFTTTKVGDSCARTRLNLLRRKLKAEILADAIHLAGLTLVEVSTVENLPRVLETQFQGRATLTLRFRISDEIEEATTFIETAEFSGSFS